MKMYMFEGSLEEIEGVLETLEPALASKALLAVKTGSRSATALSPKTGDESQPEHFVTSRFAYRALTRRRLSDAMKALLKTLRDEAPQWVPVVDLYDATGYDSSQFAGLMGAFGRRMANTDGYDSEAHFFDYQWNVEMGAWDYRLPDSVLTVLRELDLD